MPSKNWTKATIGLFSAIIFAASVFTGESINKHGLQWISGASSAVILILVMYDRWIWRLPLISRISAITGHPVIHGTWKAELEFDRDADGKSGSLTCYFSVYQTFSSIQVRGFFTTSESQSLAARIDRPQRNQTQLVFAYRSEAPYGKRNINRPHDGTVVLNVIGRPVEALGGSYYTDRGGTGTIKSVEYSKKLSESYDQATRLTYKKLS
jgi:hypothetical protein